MEIPLRYGFDVQPALAKVSRQKYKPSMDIHHIKYFLAVCETLNFTKAAEKCNVSQPALSRAIQQLEEEAGGLLFRRERNLTHITDLGMLMRPRFENVISELGDVKREARRFLSLEDASINLGIMCTIGPRRFTGLLAHFARRFPGISVQIVEGVPAKLSDNLESGAIDVAIMAQAETFPARFNPDTLYRESFMIAFPAGHRFAGMETIPIAEIKGENYLRRINCEYWDYLSDVTDACGADVHVCFASEREDWIQHLVAGGMGICFIPEFSVVVPGIQARPAVDPEVSRDICLVTMAGRRHSPAVTQFVRAIKDYAWPEGHRMHGVAA